MTRIASSQSGWLRGLSCGGAWLLVVLWLGAAPADDAPPGPQTPEEERATFQFADAALTAELIASEPLVTSPVAICWDEHYALYVAEMNDYPVGPTAGTIRRLEDRDGDGRYEQGTVFADGLNFPNGLLFAAGGLFVTAAPDLLLLKDTDGDGVADERRVLFTGFGEGNQQLRANGLTWGQDGWIYGANGRSDGDIRRVAAAEADIAPPPVVSIRTRDFRFRPNGSALEAVLGQSQFGQTTNDAGDRFMSWNTIPLRHALFDERDVQRWPRLAARAVHNPAAADETDEVFPRAPQPQTFNRESTAHFNALCGLTIYRGDALGADYRGDAFVGESLSNLVHRRTLQPQGPTYSARRGDAGQEFLAAGDPWFHPVFLTTGPDGCLYVADFYRRWVEHPQFVPEAWRNEVAWQEGAQFGRIWRIRRRDAAPSRQVHRPLDEWRRRGERPAELVELLHRHTDGWHAEVLQRLLLERLDAGAIGALEELAQAGLLAEPEPRESRAAAEALVRARALWTLAVAGKLDESVLLRALHDLAPAVREQAVRIAGSHTADAVLMQETLAALTDDPSQRVRFQLARAWAAAPRDVKAVPLAELAAGDDPGGWIALAVCASAGNAAPLVLERRLMAARLASPAPGDLALLFDLATALADRGELPELIAALQQLAGHPAPWGSPEYAVLAGLGAGLADRGKTVRGVLLDLGQEALAKKLNDRLRAALGVAPLTSGAAAERLRLVQALAAVGDQSTAATVVELVDGAQPSEVAAAALRALASWDSAATAAQLVDKWPALPASLRRQLAAAAVNWPGLAHVLADALAAGGVSPLEIDPAQRQALGQLADAALAARFAGAFAAAAPPPRDVAVADYQPALDLPANRNRGAELYKQHCLTCHTMFGLGRHVGPDLTGAGHKPKDVLLVDLLDPSRQMSPDFLAYTLTTRGGRVLSGLLAAESAAGVTLRRGEGADDFVPRDEIEELAAAGKSLMPEGFEQKLTRQDTADLLEFLRLPQRALLMSADSP